MSRGSMFLCRIDFGTGIPLLVKDGGDRIRMTVTVKLRSEFIYQVVDGELLHRVTGYRIEDKVKQSFLEKELRAEVADTALVEILRKYGDGVSYDCLMNGGIDPGIEVRTRINTGSWPDKGLQLISYRITEIKTDPKEEGMLKEAMDNVRKEDEYNGIMKRLTEIRSLEDPTAFQGELEALQRRLMELLSQRSGSGH